MAFRVTSQEVVQNIKVVKVQIRNMFHVKVTMEKHIL